ncbi:hypothetical protein ACFOHS_22710 [Jhaorihella thermophila]
MRVEAREDDTRERPCRDRPGRLFWSPRPARGAGAGGRKRVAGRSQWFGNDLRAGACEIRPGVETSAKSTTPQAWRVNGVDRASAHLVSTDAEDRPVDGGTPSDAAVVQTIRELSARG